MSKIDQNSTTITSQIYATIFQLLEQNPDGVRWTEILKQIQKAHPDFHPKTVNGCVWKLIEKYPDKIYKPEKGLFRLKEYK